MRGLTTTVVSHATIREGERNQTLPQIQDLNPDVILTRGKPSQTLMRTGSRDALALAVDRGHDLLFLEDDIDVAPTFGRFLHAARELDRIVTFCLLADHHLHPKVRSVAHNHHNTSPRACPPAFTRVRYLNGTDTRGWWYGTQAILVPHPDARLILERWNETPGPFDKIIRQYANATRPLIAACPTPVQHRSPRSVVHENRGRRQSMTYGVPVDWTSTPILDI